MTLEGAQIEGLAAVVHPRGGELRQACRGGAGGRRPGSRQGQQQERRRAEQGVGAPQPSAARHRSAPVTGAAVVHGHAETVPPRNEQVSARRRPVKRGRLAGGSRAARGSACRSAGRRAGSLVLRIGERAEIALEGLAVGLREIHAERHVLRAGCGREAKPDLVEQSAARRGPEAQLPRELSGIRKRQRGCDPRLVAVDAQLQRRRTARGAGTDRKSTRLNSSHVEISYAVFCLKKKKKHKQTT